MKKNEITAHQLKSLKALALAGGTVGHWLDAYKAAGIDGRTVPALAKKGLVRYHQPEDRNQWSIVITDAGQGLIS